MFGASLVLGCWCLEFSFVRLLNRPPPDFIPLPIIPLPSTLKMTPLIRISVWSLNFDTSLVLGCWCLEFLLFAYLAYFAVKIRPMRPVAFPEFGWPRPPRVALKKGRLNRALELEL